MCGGLRLDVDGRPHDLDIESNPLFAMVRPSRHRHFNRRKLNVQTYCRVDFKEVGSAAKSPSLVTLDGGGGGGDNVPNWGDGGFDYVSFKWCCP